MREKQSGRPRRPPATAPPGPELLEAIDAIVWEADAESRLFTFVSRGAEGMLGHAGDRWLGEPDFATGLVYVEDREAALSAGYQQHAAKPIEPAELAAAVATLAGRTAAR